jgi:hypothetical protein
MNRLFDLKENKIVLNSDIIALPFLRKIWERDTSKDKETAIAELSIIAYFADFSSPYKEYSEKDRINVLYKHFLKEEYEPDEAITEAIASYQEMQETAAMKLLRQAKEGVHKLSDFFQFMPVEHKDYTKNLEKVGNIVESVEILEEKVRKDVAIKGSKIKGSTALNPREIPKKKFRE